MQLARRQFFACAIGFALLFKIRPGDAAAAHDEVVLKDGWILRPEDLG